jgi:hypothetical protein
VCSVLPAAVTPYILAVEAELELHDSQGFRMGVGDDGGSDLPGGTQALPV